MEPNTNALLVGSDSEVASVLVAALTERGFRVHVVDGYERATRMIDTIAPSVVLIDVSAAGMDAPGLLRELRIQTAGAIPLVIFSGSHRSALLPPYVEDDPFDPVEIAQAALLAVA